MTTLLETTQFDGSLYTYNYTVQNNSTVTISEFDIFVGSPQIGQYLVIPPNTEPLGWTVTDAYSGSVGYAPYNMYGVFIEFDSNYGPASIAPDQSASFSITTSFAPRTDGANDYFTFGCQSFAPSWIGCDVQAFGNITAPDGANWLPNQSDPPATPLPGTLLLLIIPLTAIIYKLKHG